MFYQDEKPMYMTQQRVSSEFFSTFCVYMHFISCFVLLYNFLDKHDALSDYFPLNTNKYVNDKKKRKYLITNILLHSCRTIYIYIMKINKYISDKKIRKKIFKK